MRKTSVALAVLILCSCATAVAPPAGDKLTLGTVQKEIRVGMSGSDVVSILGSPNIVTTDEQRRETWVYDKMSTNVSYEQREGMVFLVIAGGAGASGTTSTSQRTLTVIIKFDEKHAVRDFAYHASSF